MTLRQQLQEQFEKDLEKAPESFVNKEGVQLTLDRTQKIYVGFDRAPRKRFVRLQKKFRVLPFLLHPVFYGKREWIAALQFPWTKIPIFFSYCTKCRAPNVTGIWQQGHAINCRRCGNSFTVNITPAEKSIQDILGRLDLG